MKFRKIFKTFYFDISGDNGRVFFGKAMIVNGTSPRKFFSKCRWQNFWKLRSLLKICKEISRHHFRFVLWPFREIFTVELKSMWTSYAKREVVCLKIYEK